MQTQKVLLSDRNNQPLEDEKSYNAIQVSGLQKVRYFFHLFFYRLIFLNYIIFFQLFQHLSVYLLLTFIQPDGKFKHVKRIQHQIKLPFIYFWNDNFVR